MSGSAPYRQALAHRLMRVAVVLWPAQHSAWRDAACAEFAALRDRKAAWTWALGCCRAALGLSLDTGAIVQFRWLRWPLALFALSLAHDHWFAGRLLRAWHAEPAWALQFLSTAQSVVVARMPSNLHLLFAATGLCYAVAGYRLLRPGRSSGVWYAAASLGSLLGLLSYSGYAIAVGAWRPDAQATAYLHWLASAAALVLLLRYARNPFLHTGTTPLPPGDRSCG